jgi:hypothetical protein
MRLTGVNEIMRADIMGHARQGTNAKHYSKRMQTEGLDVVLAERLEFLKRNVPEITSDVAPAPNPPASDRVAITRRLRPASTHPKRCGEAEAAARLIRFLVRRALAMHIPAGDPRLRAHPLLATPK